MNDLKMAMELTDMGYDVDLDLKDETYSETLVAEMAVNESYKWNDSLEIWE